MKRSSALVVTLLAALAATPTAAQADNPGFGPTIRGMYLCSVQAWPPAPILAPGGLAIQVEGQLTCLGNRIVDLNVCLQRLNWVPQTLACSNSGWRRSKGGTVDQGGIFARIAPGYLYRVEARGHVNFPAGSGYYYNGISHSGWVR